MKYKIKLNGVEYELEIEKIEDAPTTSKDTPLNNSHKHKTEYAQMPGLVSKVFVQNGQNVKSGQTVLILESMKMENEIIAQIDGIVDNIAPEGKNIKMGELLFDVQS